MITNNTKKQVKAVGLISGGLDSTLAARIVKDLGVDVHGVYFAMPWGCCDKQKAIAAAENIGIKLIVLQLDERYLEIIRKPKHGYGSALNPCVDCRIHMFSRAAQYMRHIEADFIFTGEVLGQRPMSQKKNSMRWIEEGTGLQGRLLRPLSAQLLDPTIPELENKIDRNKLLDLSGRSRKPQLELVEGFGISEYSLPAGGCALTDSSFAERMKDTLKYGYRNYRETIALKWGRHFRLNENYKIILGRDEAENEALMQYAHPDDYIMHPSQGNGPTLILKGPAADQKLLRQCAGFIQHFSKMREDESIEVCYWQIKEKNNQNYLQSLKITESFLESVKI